MATKYAIFIQYTILCVFNICVNAENDKVVLCNLMSWSMYRNGDGKFDIATDLDPFICTHVVYSFIGIDENTNRITSRDEWSDEKVNGKGLIFELTRMRDLKNPNLKILASIGGWDLGSKKFSDMAASTVKIDAFVTSVMEFVRRYNLDGIDICWEFPTDRDGIPEDKMNFITLLKELKNKLRNKILTAHISGKRYIIDPGYDLPSISKYVDYINVMTYGYNGAWEKMTGINAPLNSINEFNVVFTIDYLIKRGANPSKILLGISTYGSSVNMDRDHYDGNYLRVGSDSGYKNQWTGERGLVGYNEVCYLLNSELGWKVYWDNSSSTPFAVNERKFMSYDNEESILEKLKLVDLKELAGVNVWSLDTDDFKANCHGKKFPIVSLVKETLKNEEKEETTTMPSFTFLGVVTHAHG